MIYLDNHATTPCDPRVVEAMLPWLTDHFANPHSDSHAAGRQSAAAMHAAIERLAIHLGASPTAVVITSGATESINLAMRGVLTHPRNRRNRLVVCTAEHPAVLDVAADLQSTGIEVAHVPVHPHDHSQPGRIDLDALRNAVTDQTALVNVMLANNEMGAIQPIAEVAEITHAAGGLLHCDATQAVGRIAVDVQKFDIDLLSASAHKFYGPKGVGLLVVGNGRRRVRLRPQIVGGGQQSGLRSGTMNPAAIIAMSVALQLANAEREVESARIADLRDQLWRRLSDGIEGLQLNGPNWSKRLPGNLNFRLKSIEGETWMAAAPEIAFSSGSACSSADAKPSHVLTAMGLSESQARRSVRFGLGRFTTQSDIDVAADQLIEAHRRLVK